MREFIYMLKLHAAWIVFGRFEETARGSVERFNRAMLVDKLRSMAALRHAQIEMSKQLQLSKLYNRAAFVCNANGNNELTWIRNILYRYDLLAPIAK